MLQSSYLRKRLNTKSKNKIPVIIVCGPTASGKTELTQKLFFCNAHVFPRQVELVSADSVQVYRGMDIGSAKPSKRFLAEVRHHLVDICDIHEEFGLGDFVRQAQLACYDIYNRGNLPVVVGGTAFFIKGLVEGLPSTPRANLELRKSIDNRLQLEGAQALWNELFRVDHISANKIHVNDAYRIKRALEVYYDSGKPLSDFLQNHKSDNAFEFFCISLDMERSVLYERINKRVDKMFEDGLYAEVSALHTQGYDENSPGMKAIGYREFFPWNKNPPLDEIKLRIQKNTRAYAKRQQTFFNRLPIDLRVKNDDIAIIYAKIQNFLDRFALST